jgi:hypothetical protein
MGILSHLHNLRSDYFDVARSLRQRGTFRFNVFVFALAERKNEKRYNMKYRSAEG